jgi:predicted phosphodiesterase
VVSDTHLNNKQCDIDSLHKFYEDADKEWVDAFIHAGDLTDWINVYKWQIYELLNLSFDDQLRYVAENYPKIDGKETYFISGNHDESWLKQWWINFGDAVSRERLDMKHLGFYNASLKLNGFDVEMQHGWGSSPYAASYHLQRFMERIPQEVHLDLRVLWHYHRELSMLYRGALAMLPWAFLKENLLAKRFKLGNNISGSVVKLKRNEDGKLEFLPHMFKYK